MNDDELYSQMVGGPSKVPVIPPGEGQKLFGPFKYLEENVNPFLRENVLSAFDPLQALMHGATQGGHNTMASAFNLPLEAIDSQLGTDLHINPIDLTNQINPQYSWLNQLGQLGGQIGTEGLMYGTMGPVGAGLKGWPRVASEAAKGLGVGYAGGEFSPGGRPLNALLSALTPFVSKAISPAGMLAEEAETIAKDLGPQYKKLLSEAKGVTKPKFSDSLFDLINDKRLTKNAMEAWDRFSQSPSAETAKHFYSVLKAEQRDMIKGLAGPRSLGDAELRTYNLLGDAAKDVKNQIIKGFEKSGYKAGKGELEALDKLWAQQYGPYDFPELDLFRAGKGSGKNVSKAVHGMEDYQKDIYKELLSKHPELYLNKILGNKYVKGALSGAGTLTGMGMLGKPYIDRFIENITNQGAHE